jgi:predicted nucleotidyltransferase
MQLFTTTDGTVLEEGKDFKRLNFPDPWGYGDRYRPIFPPRHHAMKAVIDNIPDTVEKIYIFGSSIRLDSAVNSDLDIFMVGTATNDDMLRIMRAVPEGEKVDLLIETEKEFHANLADNYSLLYRKIFERGYKFYERESK